MNLEIESGTLPFLHLLFWSAARQSARRLKEKLDAAPGRPARSVFNKPDTFSAPKHLLPQETQVKTLLFLAFAAFSVAQPNQDKIAKEVRHELIMLPYYGVFDNLAYRVDGTKVTLFGQATRPTLKSDAENVVKRIEGVQIVDNEIEVLPLSPNDDQIRRATYRKIYSNPALQRYQLGAVPPIHIIVKNGNVTLVGVVDSETDKNLAGIAANGVSGAFKVTNDLAVGK
jgi:hyperosmotically inducible protein